MLIAMCLSGAAINLVFYGTVFVLSLFFQTVKGYDALQTGIAFIPLTAVLTVSTMISSRVARRVSAVRIITTGFSVQIVGFLLLSQLSVHSMVRKLDPFFSFRSEAKEGDRIMSFICSGSTRVTMG
ncbi:hypothetical protein [Erwinia aphidicola]